MKNTKKTIIMSDYTLGWYNNNQNDEYLKRKIKLLNQVKRFVVIIPKTKRIFELINVPFSIMMTNKDLLKGDDGSSVYRIYENTKSVVIKSNRI